MAQKLGQLQPFLAVFLQECTGTTFWANLTPFLLKGKKKKEMQMMRDSLQLRPSFRALGNAAKLANALGGRRAPPRPMSAAAAAAALLRFCDDSGPRAVALGQYPIVTFQYS